MRGACMVRALKSQQEPVAHDIMIKNVRVENRTAYELRKQHTALADPNIMKFSYCCNFTWLIVCSLAVLASTVSQRRDIFDLQTT